MTQVQQNARGVRAAEAGFLALCSLVVFCVGLIVMLGFSPLNEMPDTYCQTLFRQYDDPGGCQDIYSRRLHWILLVVLVGVIAAVSAFVIRQRRQRMYTGTLAGAIAALAVFTALGGAAFLTIGIAHAECGSTLSRVDPYGEYSPDRPIDCAPHYRDSRRDAWILGLAAGLALAGAAGIQAQRDQTSRADPD